MRAGDWLVRVLIPLYICAGALLKFFTGSPAELPDPLLRIFATATIGERTALVPHNMDRLFVAVVGAELLLAATMVLHRSLARPLAIALLAVFAAILLAQLAAGQETCGCFGRVKPPTGLMLVIDVSLLALTLLLPRRRPNPPMSGGRWALLFGAAILAAVGPALGQVAGLAGVWRFTGGAVELDVHVWYGRRWEELPIAKFLKVKPADFPEQDQVWVFYKRACPTCRRLFETRFAENAGRRVVAVEIPPLPKPPPPPPPPGAAPQPPEPADPVMPDVVCPDCVFAPLPADRAFYVVTTPIVVHIRDGVVMYIERHRE